MLTLSSKLQMWKFHVVVLQKGAQLFLSACCKYSMLIFYHSTNEILCDVVISIAIVDAKAPLSRIQSTQLPW